MRTIQQTIEIPGASAAELFEIFMDSEKHSELIGAEARVDREAGDAFSLFDGAVRGTNLLVVPNRLTVKSWRGSVWHDGDLDSIEVMTFEDTDRGARINLVQTAPARPVRRALERLVLDPPPHALRGQRGERRPLSGGRAPTWLPRP